MSEENKSYQFVEDSVKTLAGKVLTIVDASYSDSSQRKAVKDLIRNEFSQCMYKFQDRYFDGKQGHSVDI